MALAGLRQRALAGRPGVARDAAGAPAALILLRSDYRAGPIFEPSSAGSPIRWRARARRARTIATDGRLLDLHGAAADRRDRAAARRGRPMSARAALLCSGCSLGLLVRVIAAAAVAGSALAVPRGSQPRFRPAPRAPPAARVARPHLWRDAGGIGRRDPGPVRQSARLARPYRDDQRRGAWARCSPPIIFGFAAPLALSVGAMGGALGALLPAAAARRARGRDRDPACSPGSRSARWPGR